jgi:hypothetical protein
VAWQPNWERIATIGSFIGAIIGFGGRQAYLKGKFDERIKDMEGRFKAVSEKVDKHDERLQSGAVAFGRIDEKLDAVKESQIRIENAVKDQTAMLMDHIKDGAKEAR